ncbi:MAG: hypothetical protein H0V56_00165 [Chthoniobacterales bacterium]|nr:hypothetical protein [Chthoniobacterales bacterium]
MDQFNENDIGKLLRLKRYEQPPPGYFDDFLHEFHRRQRAELLRQPAWRVWMERAQSFMTELSVPALSSTRMAAAAVLVCAAVLSLKVYQAPENLDLASATVAIHEPRLVAAGSDRPEGVWSLSTPVEARALDLSPFDAMNRRTQTHRHAAPPRYVLDSTPVSYEPASFRF